MLEWKDDKDRYELYLKGKYLGTLYRHQHGSICEFNLCTQLGGGYREESFGEISVQDAKNSRKDGSWNYTE